MEDHVDRQTQMGTRVLINDGWYNTFVAIFVSAVIRHGIRTPHLG